jgi:DNA protecting protein DprA
MWTANQRATVALWSIQGLGPITLNEIRTKFSELGEILELPIESWAPLIEFRGDAQLHLLAAGSLAAAADRVERACRAHHARVLFQDDEDYPWRLKKIEGAPPVLFAFGPGGATSRRPLAIVGTRTLEPGLRQRAQEIAAEAAANGLCIVSGAASGTDQAAHQGAILAGGETWAFLGSALDEIDAGQREITNQILAAGGTVFTEFPPGCRANSGSFIRRNRLISGASQAVLVFRAPFGSGALHTAEFAIKQGRPLLVTPGDPWSRIAKGSNDFIRSGLANIHLELEDLLKAVGLVGEVSKTENVQLDLTGLGDLAKRVLAQLENDGATDFEGLLDAFPALSSGELSAALVELEVFGAVLHKGGRRYEKR